MNIRKSFISAKFALKRLKMIVALIGMVTPLFSGCAALKATQQNVPASPRIDGSLKVGDNEVSYAQLEVATEAVEQRGGKLLVHPFEIDLELTSQAEKTLRERNGTIELVFIFHGDWKTPRSEGNARYFSDGYGFVIRKEVPVRGLYRIEDLELPADFYDPLPDKDLSIVLNIASGRKSSKDNPLRCDILIGRLSELAGRRFYLKGNLIRPVSER